MSQEVSAWKCSMIVGEKETQSKNLRLYDYYFNSSDQILFLWTAALERYKFMSELASIDSLINDNNPYVCTSVDKKSVRKVNSHKIRQNDQ